MAYIHYKFMNNNLEKIIIIKFYNLFIRNCKEFLQKKIFLIFFLIFIHSFYF